MSRPGAASFILVDSVRLLGRDYVKFGHVAIEAVPGGAIGITRGRHPKAYPYTDPNEDAALIAVGEEWSLQVMADGHNGLDASHAAVEAIHNSVGPNGFSPPDDARELFEVGHQAIAALAPGLNPEASPPGTTLTVVLVTPEASSVAWVGDSVAARIREGRARDLTPLDPRFLNPFNGLEPRFASFRHKPGDLVITASDGFTNFVKKSWPSTLASLAKGANPTSLVSRAIDTAGDGGSGDNIAITALLAPN